MDKNKTTMTDFAINNMLIFFKFILSVFSYLKINIYKSTFGVCPLFTGIVFNSVRMHRNSAHIQVIAAHEAFSNHQYGVGSVLLYHIQAAKCMV
jgi:hypothetical protein